MFKIHYSFKNLRLCRGKVIPTLKKLLLLIGIIALPLVLICCVKKTENPTPTSAIQPELKLLDFPEIFKKTTLIIIGDKSSEIEIQAANEIASYLENKTRNRPLIKKYSEISDEDKRNYNLIVVGTPKTNPFLQEVYAMTNATRVTEEFPGEGKGVLEILRNPWDEEKAMLLVEGWDEWGVKGTENSLLEPMKIHVKKKIASYTLNEDEMSEIIELAKQYLLSNNIKVFSFKSAEKINLNIEGPAKEILTESFPNLPLYTNNMVWEVRWQGEKEGIEYIIIIDPKNKGVVCGYRSIKMTAPGIMPLKGGVQ